MTQTFTLFAIAAVVGMGCSSPEHTDKTEPSAAVVAPSAASAVSAEVTAAMTIESPIGRLTRVEDPSLVCMVNNQFMGRPQIPIVAAENTYFGCCEMCKGRLANDPSVRVGKEPGTGRMVDKSKALIAQDAKGATYYFENETSFAAYGESPKTL